MRHNSRNEPSQRQLRVGEQIRHIVSDTMRRGHFHDKALLDCANITVTEVRISPDLKNATAYITTLGGGDLSEILKALNGSAAVFQKDIGSQAQMKFTPRIRFAEDGSFAEGARIEKIFRELSDRESLN